MGKLGTFPRPLQSADRRSSIVKIEFRKEG